MIQRRNQGNRHDFGIAHLTLDVFLMLHCFEQVVT
jgi:hypothetical protein